MAELEEFGADRDDIGGSSFKKYKGKKGNTDRIGIIYHDPKKLFRGLKAHYKERYFACKSEKGKAPEICCTHSYEGNLAKYRIGAVIVVYDLVVKAGKTKLNGYEVMPWVFGEKMYDKLNSADKEFPLATHDIKLTCTNDEYQNIDIQSCKECIWVNGDLKEKVLEEAQSYFDNMSRSLAATLSLSEVREQLGIDEPGSEDAAADVDLEDVIS